MAVDEGFGTTITFQSGFFTGLLRSVDVDGIERTALETSHNTTTNGWRTFRPSDLKDAGELTVGILFEPDADWKTALGAAAETVTITFPVPAGLTTGAKIAASGFLRSFTLTDPYDDMMTATAVIKFSGEPTLTDAA